MSQVPGASIFAEVELRRTRLAQSIREVERDIRQGLSRITAQNLTVTVATRIDPNLQRNLNAALARLTINPINVPVNFVPGNLPGGGAGGGGNGNGNGNGAGGGGGARGNVGQYRNPFSQYGLARLLGGGMAAYGGLEAIHIATGLADAYDTASHPERVLRGMDRLGARHGAYGDKFMEGQAGQIAGIEGRQQALGVAESVPVAGALVRLIDAINGTSHAMDDMKRNAEGVAEIHRYAREQRDETDKRRAELTHDPLAVLDDRQNAERQTEASALATAKAREQEAFDAIKSHFYEGSLPQERITSDPALNAARKARKELEAAQAEKEPLRAAERKQAEADEATRHALSGVNAAHAEAMAGVTGMQAGGDTEGALKGRQAADIAQLRDSYNARIKSGNLSDKQRADLGEEYSAKYDEKKAQQKSELEQFYREHEKSAGDSAARIETIEKTSAEEVLRARGESLAASLAATKRATDERVAQLEREAKAERDTVKKGQLVREAAAERVAGVERQRAIMIEQQREADRTSRQTTNAMVETTHDASGEHRRARDDAVRDRYAEEMQRIEEEYGANPTDPKVAALKKQKQADASFRRFTGDMQNQHHNQMEDRSTIISTADAAARARGQGNVGEVLSMQAEFEDMERDARGDPARERLVAANEKARIAAMRRELRPKSQTFGIEEYHDALQQSITSGYRNSDALKLLDAADHNVGAAGRADPGENPANSLAASAKDMSEAANVIKNARPLGIFRRN